MGACYRRLALAAAVWEFPLAGCWRVLLSSPHHPAFLSPCVCMCVCSAEGGGQFVSVPGCQRNTQRMRLLLHLSDNGSAA